MSVNISFPEEQNYEDEKSNSRKYPDYCRTITFKDSNGVVRELVFPKALDLDRPKRARTTFSREQLERLESEFTANQYLVGRERSQLAKTLGLSETQVKVWFQNRRTKHKRDKDKELEVQEQQAESVAAQRLLHILRAGTACLPPALGQEHTAVPPHRGAQHSPPSLSAPDTDCCSSRLQISPHLHGCVSAPSAPRPACNPDLLTSPLMTSLCATSSMSSLSSSSSASPFARCNDLPPEGAVGGQQRVRRGREGGRRLREEGSPLSMVTPPSALFLGQGSAFSPAGGASSGLFSGSGRLLQAYRPSSPPYTTTSIATSTPVGGSYGDLAFLRLQAPAPPPSLVSRGYGLPAASLYESAALLADPYLASSGTSALASAAHLQARYPPLAGWTMYPY